MYSRDLGCIFSRKSPVHLCLNDVPKAGYLQKLYVPADACRCARLNWSMLGMNFGASQ